MCLDCVKCFRPLSGSYISQFSVVSLIFGQMQKSKFPSPIGELHFSMDMIFYIHDRIPKPFPSPIGELHFSISYEKPKMLCRRSFPSPIGELHFSIHLQEGDEMSELIVSVPYRGATFLNKKKLSEQRKELACFRPLSGSYISQ